MLPWCDTPTQLEAPTYAVGDTVYSGDCAGTVVAMADDEATMGVVWSDSEDGKPITYPTDASYLRKKFPWE